MSSSSPASCSPGAATRVVLIGSAGVGRPALRRRSPSSPTRPAARAGCARRARRRRSPCRPRRPGPRRVRRDGGRAGPAQVVHGQRVAAADQCRDADGVVSAARLSGAAAMDLDGCSTDAAGDSGDRLRGGRAPRSRRLAARQDTRGQGAADLVVSGSHSNDNCRHVARRRPRSRSRHRELHQAAHAAALVRRPPTSSLRRALRWSASCGRPPSSPRGAARGGRGGRRGRALRHRDDAARPARLMFRRLAGPAQRRQAKPSSRPARESAAAAQRRQAEPPRRACTRTWPGRSTRTRVMSPGPRSTHARPPVTDHQRVWRTRTSAVPR